MRRLPSTASPRRCSLDCARPAVYHVTEEGWTKISADDSGMKLHYAYAEEGFGAKN